MGLAAGDGILVYSSAPEQRFAFWFRIKIIETLRIEEMWRKHHRHLGIAFEDYSGYFSGLRDAVGLHIGEVHPFHAISLSEIEELVPGFVPPQGIIWLRDEFGRFRELLSRLSSPLTDSLFPQQSLRLDL
jgi:predicted transcriptional regulator